MSDAIIFMSGIVVGSIVTMFFCMVATISDFIREREKNERIV